MRLSQDVLIFLVLCGVISVSESKKIQLACIISLVILMLIYHQKKNSTIFQLHLLDSDGMNEVLIMDSMIGSRSFLFLLDTGYAGPPVLSRSYLSINDPIHMKLKQRYNTILNRMRNVTDEDEHKGINSYLQDGKCFPFTSGCTMKLMSIGTTQEQQADMLMCPMIKIKNISGGLNAPKMSTLAHADVFVTNSLKHSVHILTCDFLLHHSPCVISIGHETLKMNMNAFEYITISQSFIMYPAVFSGGSFVVPFNVDHGEQLFCTIDTGAPGPICVGKNAIHKIKNCRVRQKKSLIQNGVNGERICSEIIEIDVTFAGSIYSVPVFVNDLSTEQVDGYVGLAFLRAFDILITNTEIGFKKNKNKLKNLFDFESVAANGGCDLNLQCL